MDEIFAKHKTYLLRLMFIFCSTTIITIVARYLLK
jgi:hypothetical protein